VLATIAALAPATLVDVRQTPLHAHRVEQAVALVAPLAAPIPILLTRIRRPLPNASSFGVIVACRRKPVSMPPCFTATTWSPSRFSLTMAGRIIKTNAPTSLSLKLQRTSYTWAVTLQTTKTLESIFLASISCRVLFLGRVQDILSGGLSTWRALCLKGCFSVFFVIFSLSVSVDGSTFFSLPDGLRHLFGDHNPYSILHIPYSMLYAIYDLEGSNGVNLQSRWHGI